MERNHRVHIIIDTVASIMDLDNNPFDAFQVSIQYPKGDHIFTARGTCDLELAKLYGDGDDGKMDGFIRSEIRGVVRGFIRKGKDDGVPEAALRAVSIVTGVDLP